MFLSSSLPVFESHGGRLELFDDGHCPETFRLHQHERVAEAGKNDGDLVDNDDHNINAAPRILGYHTLNSTLPSPVYIYDYVLNPNHAHMLYKVTASGKTTSHQR